MWLSIGSLVFFKQNVASSATHISIEKKVIITKGLSEKKKRFLEETKPCSVMVEFSEKTNFRYRDLDHDGFGNPRCLDTQGVFNNSDCNDNKSSINPDANEIFADGIDNDCDGIIDEADVPNPPTSSLEVRRQRSIEDNAGLARIDSFKKEFDNKTAPHPPMTPEARAKWSRERELPDFYDF